MPRYRFIYLMEEEVNSREKDEKERTREIGRACQREKKIQKWEPISFILGAQVVHTKNSTNLALSNFISMVVIPNNGFVYIPSIMIIWQIKFYFAYFFYFPSPNVLFSFLVESLKNNEPLKITNACMKNYL